jgi:hypothetical protein
VADDLKKSAAGTAPTKQAQAASRVGAPSRAERARQTAYRGRFAIFFLLLAMVAGAALGTAVVLLGRGSPAPAPPWSDWEPVGSAQRRTAQIADRVTDPYRLPSGNQIDTVTYAGPPTVTGPDGTTFQVRAIAVRPDVSRGAAEADDVNAFDASKTVMYTLCGLGNHCSVAEGKPSNARGALLRREALELSLYTLKYVDGIDSVVVLLPPRPDGKAATAVFLERGDVSHELSRPLARTLTSTLTPGVGQIPPVELQTVEGITRPRLYQYSYLQAQDGSPVMVLDPAIST